MAKQFDLNATDVVVIVAALKELKKKDSLSERQQEQIDAALEKFNGKTVYIDRRMTYARRQEEHRVELARAKKLKSKGYSNTSIATQMNLSEASVRTLLCAPLHKDCTST